MDEPDEQATANIRNKRKIIGKKKKKKKKTKQEWKRGDYHRY